MIHEEKKYKILNAPIETLNFSTRVLANCKALKVERLVDAICMYLERHEEFFEIFGEKSLRELESRFDELAIDVDNVDSGKLAIKCAAWRAADRIYN